MLAQRPIASGSDRTPTTIGESISAIFEVVELQAEIILVCPVVLYAFEARRFDSTFQHCPVATVVFEMHLHQRVDRMACSKLLKSGRQITISCKRTIVTRTGFTVARCPCGVEEVMIGTMHPEHRLLRLRWSTFERGLIVSSKTLQT